MRTGGSLRRVATALAVAMGALFFLQAPAAAEAAPFTIGDVFAGVGNGLIREYTPTGVFVQELDTLSTSLEQTGMCFDGNNATSSLRSTNFTVSDMSRLFQTGTPQHPWGTGFNSRPESCLVTIDPVTRDTVVYVGQADGTRDVLKLDANGVPIRSYDVATEDRGSDWIDLAADRCTLYYTSEGFRILRYDVCTGVQLTAFATLPTGPCYALRTLVDGEVLVACSDFVHRLSPTGALLASCPKSPEEFSFLFALNLDPDNLTFWTAGYDSGNVYHYNTQSCAILSSFNAPPAGFALSGLAVFGEPVVSLPGQESTPGKGSGGGYIDSLTGNVVGLATMLIQKGSPGGHLNSKATLGFIDQFKAGDTIPKGNLTYDDHDSNVTVKAVDWSLLSIRPSTAAECPTLTPGLHATLRGMGTLNGMPGHPVRLEVDDCGEPGSGTMPDQFKILVDEPTGYMAAGPLIGGNIQVSRT